MSLTTKEKVKSFFRNIDTTSAKSAITDAEIENWIEIDQSYVLGKFHTLYRATINEIDNPLSAVIVGDIIAMFVADRIDDVLNNYTEADKKPQWGKKARERLSEYVTEIDKNGKQAMPNVKLPDAEFIGTQMSKTQMANASRNEPVFRKDRSNW